MHLASYCGESNMVNSVLQLFVFWSWMPYVQLLVSLKQPTSYVTDAPSRGVTVTLHEIKIELTSENRMLIGVRICPSFPC